MGSLLAFKLPCAIPRTRKIFSPLSIIIKDIISFIRHLPIIKFSLKVFEEQRFLPIFQFELLGIACPRQIRTRGSDVFGFKLFRVFWSLRWFEGEIVQIEKITKEPSYSKILGALRAVSSVLLPISICFTTTIPMKLVRVIGRGGVAHLE